jgi:hypothetical protein
MSEAKKPSLKESLMQPIVDCVEKNGINFDLAIATCGKKMFDAIALVHGKPKGLAEFEIEASFLPCKVRLDKRKMNRFVSVGFQKTTETERSE